MFQWSSRACYNGFLIKLKCCSGAPEYSPITKATLDRNLSLPRTSRMSCTTIKRNSYIITLFITAKKLCLSTGGLRQPRRSELVKKKKGKNSRIYLFLPCFTTEMKFCCCKVMDFLRNPLLFIKDETLEE